MDWFYVITVASPNGDGGHDLNTFSDVIRFPRDSTYQDKFKTISTKYLGRWGRSKRSVAYFQLAPNGS
jgi:hypothetical protein